MRFNHTFRITCPNQCCFRKCIHPARQNEFRMQSNGEHGYRDFQKNGWVWNGLTRDETLISLSKQSATIFRLVGLLNVKKARGSVHFGSGAASDVNTSNRMVNLFGFWQCRQKCKSHYHGSTYKWLITSKTICSSHLSTNEVDNRCQMAP